MVIGVGKELPWAGCCLGDGLMVWWGGISVISFVRVGSVDAFFVQLRLNVSDHAAPPIGLAQPVVKRGAVNLGAKLLNGLNQKLVCRKNMAGAIVS